MKMRLSSLVMPGMVMAMLLMTHTARLDGAESPLWAYVGTYTGANAGGSEGIYVFRFDPATGQAGEPRLAAASENPSFLAVHPTAPYLYAVNEVVQYQGQASGAVTAFQIDAQTGKLRELNQQLSRGGAPCHLVVDATGGNVLVANYVGGNVAVLPIEAQGRLAPASSTIQHKGSSVNRRRQGEPHAHSINLDAGNRFALAADLGIDRIMVYRFNPSSGQLKPHDPDSAQLAPGSGPRHLAFHPNNRFAYVINELNLTVTAYTFDQEQGVLDEIQTVSTVPSGIATQGFSTAEVRVHPSGRFLYGSNRGHHSIAIFAIDGETGMLSPRGHESTQGETPRNFALDPQGKFLFAENQGTGSIVVFRIDPSSGRLEATGTQIEVPSPVCIRFFDPSRGE